MASGLSVAKLLEALNLTTEFEQETAKRMGMPVSVLSAAGQVLMKTQCRQFDKIAALSPITHGSAIVSISSVFKSYLGIFVDAQDRALSDMVQVWRSRKSSLEGSSASGAATDATDQTCATAPRAPLLPSSTELFYFYKEAIERCAQLSKKQPFLDLCNVFKKWLKVYAEEVLGGYLSKNTAERRSNDGRLNQQEILAACTVLNTADYCADTTAQLEERLKRKIDPELADKVSLETEKELFST